jgi:glucose-1-phosphate thymidylyltransferase
MGDNTITADRRIVDSLIGRKATITPLEEKQPAGERMIVGRNTTLEL